LLWQDACLLAEHFENDDRIRGHVINDPPGIFAVDHPKFVTVPAYIRERPRGGQAEEIAVLQMAKQEARLNPSRS
jgi:hypothetical protein